MEILPSRKQAPALSATRPPKKHLRWMPFFAQSFLFPTYHKPNLASPSRRLLSTCLCQFGPELAFQGLMRRSQDYSYCDSVGGVLLAWAVEAEQWRRGAGRDPDPRHLESPQRQNSVPRATMPEEVAELSLASEVAEAALDAQRHLDASTRNRWAWAHWCAGRCAVPVCSPTAIAFVSLCSG